MAKTACMCFINTFYVFSGVFLRCKTTSWQKATSRKAITLSKAEKWKVTGGSVEIKIDIRIYFRLLKRICSYMCSTEFSYKLTKVVFTLSATQKNMLCISVHSDKHVGYISLLIKDLQRRFLSILIPTLLTSMCSQQCSPSLSSVGALLHILACYCQLQIIQIL